MRDQVLNNIIIAYFGLKVHQLKGKHKKKKRPVCRVNPYLELRNLKGRFVRDFEYMQENVKVFNESFHMDIDSFNELYQLLEKHLRPKRNSRRDAIDPKQKLAVTLEYLASGSPMSHIADVYRISKQHLGHIVYEVCFAICAVLKPFFSALAANEFNEIADGINNLWQFPNCLGAIDAKQITLKTQNSSNSIVLFAIADHRYKFIYLDIGAYDSDSDVNSFSNSDLGKAVLSEKLEFPKNRVINNESLPLFFLGDDTFPLCKRIITPYGGKNKLTDEELIFNYRLNRARCCIENAFRILCTKWLCLKPTMFCSTDRAQRLVTACCLLHNFLIGKSAAYCSPNLADIVDAEGNLIEGECHHKADNLNSSSLIHSHVDAYRGRPFEIGKRLRNKLKNYVNSQEGAVSWQRQAIS